jgi:hypothetical protein
MVVEAPTGWLDDKAMSAMRGVADEAHREDSSTV